MPDAVVSLSFEQALADLELSVRALEDGKINLEESLAHYEKGVGLLKHCYSLLQKAEGRVRVLAGVDDKGQPQLETLDGDAADANGGELFRKRGR